MAEHWLQRTELLFGAEKMKRLHDAHVLVVGTGGVGAYAAEMICRAGVGRLTLVDADEVQITNLNRQLPAMHSTLGQPKVKILADRFRDINPELQVEARAAYLTEEDIPQLLDSEKFSFIVDAIDTITPKWGAGAKYDLSKIQFADLWDTYHCGLSKAVRKRLQKMGPKRKLPVVFSTEQADTNAILLVDNEKNKKSTAGTVSYMPAVFGCYLAQYVIEHL